MKEPKEYLGQVLRRIRNERGLSLDDTSNITGVSKPMLSQIERGESNPSVTILWKIATGLKISISELLEQDEYSLEPINIKSLKPIEEVDDKMKLYDVFPFDPLSGFECFYIELEPGASHSSIPHRSMCVEYIIVTTGVLSLEISGEKFELKAPSAIKFKADVDHIYKNETNDTVIFQNIVKY